VSQVSREALESAAARNALLAGLPPDDSRRLAICLEEVQCPAGMLLVEDAQRAEHVYFPATCVAARFCTLDDGVSVELSIVGCDGFVGVPTILGGGAMPWQVETIIGGDAIRMPAAALLAEFRRGGALERLLLRYTRELIVQVSVEASCRSHHTVERRLARLLLQVAERRSGTDLPLTQESLGMLLGSRRETVCHATARLRDQGSIHHERGHVRILDAARLRKAACACFRPIAEAKAHGR